MLLLLTEKQLAEFCRCSERSYKTMERTLSARGVPFRARPGQPPAVLTEAYCDWLMNANRTDPKTAEPNWGALTA